MGRLNVVTGAFGYSGKYIARGLLAAGEAVITLTGHPDRPNEFGGRVRAFPYRFDSPEAMAEPMAGAEVLYNTYWVRFDRGNTTHESAVRNTIALVRAARMAGVRRIVHVSISNPDRNSRLPYFRGKAQLEEEVRGSGLSFAIIRPTVIFGPEDILINNMAWLLRRMPVFLIPGNGQYRVQPIYAGDMARLAVEAGHAKADLVLDAVGPEVFTFDDLVGRIARAVGSRAHLWHAPAGAALLAAKILGAFLGDVVLTGDEVEGLMDGLLVSASPPTGTTALSSWLEENAATVGVRYASEVERHYTGSG